MTIIAKLYPKIPGNGHAAGILEGSDRRWLQLIGSAGISILQTAFWGVSGKMVISDTSWLMVGIFVVCADLAQEGEDESNLGDGACRG